MNIEDIIKWLLGGGLLGSLGLLWTTRHKPRVDTATATMAGQDSFINNLQEQLAAAQAATREERARADSCDAERRTVSRERDDLLRENGAQAHELEAVYAYLNATLQGIVTGTIPPWLTAPYVMHARLPPEAMPHFTVDEHDTGVPGVDINPAQPDNPDDGQPTDDDEPPGGTP